MTSRDIICPNCHTHIDPDVPIHIIQRGTPRFRWWVAPLNMLCISLLLYLIDKGTRAAYPNIIPWSPWAITGVWLVFLLGIALRFRSDEAWLIVPFFFFLLCIFLAALDLTSAEPDNPTNYFGLSWSFYPIVIIGILFIILPLITFAGRTSRMPIDVLQEIIELDGSEQA